MATIKETPERTAPTPPPNPAGDSKKRTFGITELAVSNGTSVFLLTLMIFFFGLSAYQSIPKEQFPEVSLPTVFINTPYPGNSAAEIENLVTRPIERELQSVTGIKDITSSSVQDFSVVIAEFESGEDIDAAVVHGPGLRWAAIGPHLTYHVGGGPGGMAAYLDHLGASQEKRWASLGTPRLTDALRSRLTAGVEAAAGGRSVAELEEERDRRVAAALRALRT